MRVVVFLLVVLSLVFGLHWLVWARLVRDVALPGAYTSAATVVVVALAASILAGILLRVVRAPRAVSSPVLWIGYTWLGVLFLLFVLLVPTEIVRAVWLALLPNDAPADPERRAFVARVLGGVVAAVGFTSAAAAVWEARRAVSVKNVRVAIAKLPKELAGFTIVQLTDVHVGPTIGKEFIDSVVERVNALEPDVIAITGDLVDGSVADLGGYLVSLADLRAKHGKFFVTGNHEYYSGVEEWLELLGVLGVRVLRNERVTIEKHGAAIDIAGVDDASSGRSGVAGHKMDVASAVAGRDTTRPLVLLAHQPKAIFEAAEHEVDLQISGHTHGGQIWPWGYLVKLDQPYVAGLHRHDGTATQVYVSHGTGYWGPPMRLAAAAEITRLELVPATPDA